MKLETRLEGMEFHAYHGWYPEEAKNGGKFRVDVVLEQFVYDDKEFKELSDVINYEEVFTMISKQMNNRRALIEELGKSIINELCERFSYIQKVKLTITKYNPAGKFDGANAVIVFERDL
ncbi:MAG: dihydroneopterin aldolase [Bacteroidia bacterium]